MSVVSLPSILLKRFCECSLNLEMRWCIIPVLVHIPNLRTFLIFSVRADHSWIRTRVTWRFLLPTYFRTTNSSLVILNLFWCYLFFSYRAQAALGEMAVLLVTLSLEKTDTFDQLLMMFFNYLLNLPLCCSNDFISFVHHHHASRQRGVRASGRGAVQCKSREERKLGKRRETEGWRWRCWWWFELLQGGPLALTRWRWYIWRSLLIT